jgi:hypothetical protein
MELKNVLAISGKPGLYRLVSSNSARLVVESIADKKKLPVPPTSKVSSLDDIAIFTMEEDVPLVQVFERIYEKTNQGEGPDPKGDTDSLRTFLSGILSDLDHSRVYDSDLKKLFTWYNILFHDGFFTSTIEESAVSDAVIVEETEDVKEQPEGE